MEYAVPVGILVAVLTWIVATYIKLYHLRQEAHYAWMRWGQATQQRNSYLLELSVYLSGSLPQGDVRPRRLKRLTDDTQRVLALFRDPPPNDELRHLCHAERKLRDIVTGTARAMETNEGINADAELTELMNHVSLCLFRQDESTRIYNLKARTYNFALQSPGTQWVAGAFGFSSLNTLN